MNFLLQKSKPLFYIILAGFVVMIFVELPLLNSALKGKEKDFNDKLFYAVLFYEDHCVRDTALMKEMTDDSAVIRLANTRIKQGLDSAFLKNEIPVNYVYAVGKVKLPAPGYSQREKLQKIYTGNNLIWSSEPQFNPGLIQTKLRMVYSGTPAPDMYYVKVFFPFKPNYLFKELLPLIIAAVLTLLMLFLCFLVLLSIIKKQNRLAETKNDFINNMTHEIKTPLFTISIASKMLAEQESIKGNEKYFSYVKTIQQETGRLTNLVDKVLHTSALEKKQFHPDKKDIDIHACICSAVKSLELIQQEEKATIELSFKASRHSIHADEANIESVIFSLADNALKYSDGPAHITISTSNDDNNIIISFVDKGIGLDMETKDLIFERFFRAHTGNLHNVKGYGIGLSHVKAIIEAHNGSVSVKSIVGKGSEFILILPCINHGK